MSFFLERILAADSFLRANENPLNPAAWTTLTGFDDLQVVSDTCEGTSISDPSGALYTGVTWPNDQFAQVTLTQMLNFGELDIFLRSNMDGTICYDILLNDNGSGGLIFDIICNPPGPTAILLYENANLSYSLGDVFKASIFGQEIIVTQNGVTIGQVSDPNVSSGSVGLITFVTTAESDVRVTNFLGGTTAGQPTVGAPMPTLFPGF